MELYGVGLTKVKKLAKEAGALYKIGGVVLINVEKLDSYIESFRV